MPSGKIHIAADTETNLRVGDVMAYRDGGSAISRLIRWGTNSHYSHIARILGQKSAVIAKLDEIIEGFEKIIKEEVGLLRFNAADQKVELEKIRREVSEMPEGWLVIESDFSFSKWMKKIFGKLQEYKTGVKIRPLCEVRKRSGSHDIFRSIYFENLSQKRFIAHALGTLAKRPEYDFVGLLWQAVIAARLKFLQRKTKIILQDISKFYCSEFSKFLDRLWGIPRFVKDFEDVPPSKTTPETESKRSDYDFIFNLSSTSKNA